MGRNGNSAKPARKSTATNPAEGIRVSSLPFQTVWLTLARGPLILSCELVSPHVMEQIHEFPHKSTLGSIFRRTDPSDIRLGLPRATVSENRDDHPPPNARSARLPIH